MPWAIRTWPGTGDSGHAQWSQSKTAVGGGFRRLQGWSQSKTAEGVVSEQDGCGVVSEQGGCRGGSQSKTAEGVVSEQDG